MSRAQAEALLDSWSSQHLYALESLLYKVKGTARALHDSDSILCMLSRFIHYAWRHWEQLKTIPGISWQRIAGSRTMISVDQELTCKVALLCMPHLDPDDNPRSHYCSCNPLLQL